MKNWLKAAGFVLLLVLMTATVIKGLQPPDGPNPLLSFVAWSQWAAEKPVGAFLTLASAIAAGIGAWGALTQVFGPKALSERRGVALADETRTAIKDEGAAAAFRDAEIVRHIQRLEAKIEAMARRDGRPYSQAEQTQRTQALYSLVASIQPAQGRMEAAVRAEDPGAVVDAAIEAGQGETAAQLRNAAKIASGFDLRRAVAALEKAAELEPNDAWTYIELAQAYHAMSKRTEARTAIDTALEKASDGWERSVALDELFSLAQSVGDGDLAFSAAQQGIALREALAKAAPDDVAIHEHLSASLDRLGIILSERGQLSEARDAFQRGLHHARRAVELNPDRIILRRPLGSFAWRIADILKSEGDLDGAEKGFKEYLAVITELAELEPDNSAWRNEMGIGETSLGDLASSRQRHSEARRHFEKSLSLRRALSEADPANTYFKRNLGGTLLRMANNELETLNAVAAYDWINKARKLYTELIAADPSEVQVRRDLMILEQDTTRVLAALGDLQAAKAAAQESVRHSDVLRSLNSENQMWQFDAGVMRKFLAGRVFEVDGAEASIPIYEEADRILTRILKKSPTSALVSEQRDMVREQLAVAHAQLAASKPNAV